MVCGCPFLETRLNKAGKENTFDICYTVTFFQNKRRESSANRRIVSVFVVANEVLEQCTALQDVWKWVDTIIHAGMRMNELLFLIWMIIPTCIIKSRFGCGVAVSVCVRIIAAVG